MMTFVLFRFFFFLGREKNWIGPKNYPSAQWSCRFHYKHWKNATVSWFKIGRYWEISVTITSEYCFASTYFVSLLHYIMWDSPFLLVLSHSKSYCSNYFSLSRKHKITKYIMNRIIFSPGKNIIYLMEFSIFFLLVYLSKFQTN